MSARRILHVSQPTVGGAAVCVRHLARAGVEAGFRVTVACPSDGDLPRWAREAGAEWVPVSLVRSPSSSDLAGLRAVRSMAGEADIVQLHASKAGALGRLAAVSLRSRPRLIFMPHGWSWLVGGRLAPAYRGVERSLASVADVIVAVSDDEREMGRPVLGRAGSRIRVIGNGVDTTRFAPDGEVAERGEEPLIVCVGRLTEAKGQSVAVRALAAMSTPGARLRLVGEGEDSDHLAALTDELGLNGRVDLYGPVADAAPQLRAADVVVVPSRWDAQSLVLLEAMACGAAIVATRVPGAGAAEGVGVLVEREDPVAMAGALDALLADPARRLELGRGARARAVEQFRLEGSQRRWVDLWTELAG